MIKNEMLDRKYCKSKEETTTNLTSHYNCCHRMFSKGQELLVARNIYLLIVVMVYGTVNHIGGSLYNTTVPSGIVSTIPTLCRLGHQWIMFYTYCQ